VPQQDYILRLIEQAGQFVRRIVSQREEGCQDLAIQTVIDGMEKLFGLSVADLATLDADLLLRQLTAEENEENARDKCLVFAALNNQAGLAFAERDLPALAQPAFHLALVFALRALDGYPRKGLPPFAPDVGLLCFQLEGFDLPEETRRLLASHRPVAAGAPP
jgi:hypothetical protein